MLNGMERTLEKQLPESDRRWPNGAMQEDGETYGFPEPRTLNPVPLEAPCSHRS
jgi:hypothetical protein